MYFYTWVTFLTWSGGSIGRFVNLVKITKIGILAKISIFFENSYFHQTTGVTWGWDIWSEMSPWGVLEYFWSNFWYLDTFWVIFEKVEKIDFFWDFWPFFLIPPPSADRNFDTRPEIGQMVLGPWKGHPRVFSNPAGKVNTQIPPFYPSICQKSQKTWFSCISHVEYSTAVEYSDGSEISTIKKFEIWRIFYIFTIFSYVT